MIHRTHSQLNLDSVVFENRNQAYGAFELRSVYNLHLIRSLMIALFFCAGSSGLLYLAHNISHMLADDIAITPQVIEVVLHPNEFIIETPPEKVEKQAIIKSTSTHVSTQAINTNFVPVDIPENDMIDPIDMGNPKGIETGSVNGDPDGTSTMPASTATVVPVDIPIQFAEIMPEFQGGAREMIRHLSSNIQYPASVADQEINGRVILSFIVNKYGKIENVQVLKSLNPVLDAEAIRVISEMPDWKPGMQNGKAVSVRMSIPILFKLN